MIVFKYFLFLIGASAVGSYVLNKNKKLFLPEIESKEIIDKNIKAVFDWSSDSTKDLLINNINLSAFSLIQNYAKEQLYNLNEFELDKNQALSRFNAEQNKYDFDNKNLKNWIIEEYYTIWKTNFINAIKKEWYIKWDSNLKKFIKDNAKIKSIYKNSIIAELQITLLDFWLELENPIEVSSKQFKYEKDFNYLNPKWSNDIIEKYKNDLESLRDNKDINDLSTDVFTKNSLSSLKDGYKIVSLLFSSLDEETQNSISNSYNLKKITFLENPPKPPTDTTWNECLKNPLSLFLISNDKANNNKLCTKVEDKFIKETNKNWSAKEKPCVQILREATTPHKIFKNVIFSRDNSGLLMILSNNKLSQESYKEKIINEKYKSFIFSFLEKNFELLLAKNSKNELIKNSINLTVELLRKNQYQTTINNSYEYLSKVLSSVEIDGSNNDFFISKPGLITPLLPSLSVKLKNLKQYEFETPTVLDKYFGNFEKDQISKYTNSFKESIKNQNPDEDEIYYTWNKTKNNLLKNDNFIEQYKANKYISNYFQLDLSEKDNFSTLIDKYTNHVWPKILNNHFGIQDDSKKEDFKKWLSDVFFIKQYYSKPLTNRLALQWMNENNDESAPDLSDYAKNSWYWDNYIINGYSSVSKSTTELLNYLWSFNWLISSKENLNEILDLVFEKNNHAFLIWTEYAKKTTLKSNASNSDSSVKSKNFKFTQEKDDIIFHPLLKDKIDSKYTFVPSNINISKSGDLWGFMGLQNESKSFNNYLSPYIKDNLFKKSLSKGSAFGLSSWDSFSTKEELLDFLITKHPYLLSFVKQWHSNFLNLNLQKMIQLINILIKQETAINYRVHDPFKRFKGVLKTPEEHQLLDSETEKKYLWSENITKSDEGYLVYVEQIKKSDFSNNLETEDPLNKENIFKSLFMLSTEDWVISKINKLVINNMVNINDKI